MSVNSELIKEWLLQPLTVRAVYAYCTGASRAKIRFGTQFAK